VDPNRHKVRVRVDRSSPKVRDRLSLDSRKLVPSCRRVPKFSSGSASNNSEPRPRSQCPALPAPVRRLPALPAPVNPVPSADPCVPVKAADPVVPMALSQAHLAATWVLVDLLDYAADLAVRIQQLSVPKRPLLFPRSSNSAAIRPSRRTSSITVR
jgi:hypothetical protein